MLLKSEAVPSGQKKMFVTLRRRAGQGRRQHEGLHALLEHPHDRPELEVLCLGRAADAGHDPLGLHLEPRGRAVGLDLLDHDGRLVRELDADWLLGELKAVLFVGPLVVE